MTAPPFTGGIASLITVVVVYVLHIFNTFIQRVTLIKKMQKMQFQLINDFLNIQITADGGIKLASIVFNSLPFLQQLSSPVLDTISNTVNNIF